MNLLHWLYDAHLTIGGHPITWREILGNAFGFASAIGGLRRRVWAWPIGIVGNVLLFSVFVAAAFEADAQHPPLLGQAGRQVFFVVVSVYGWYRWRQTRLLHEGGADDAAAVTPRWASSGERLGFLLAWAAGVVVVQWLFTHIGFGYPVDRWYYWADAWIFVGSMIATYAMAKGWNDFWLCWIGVDLVGVPVLWHFQFYPSAVLYIAYAGLVIWGFVVWLQVSRQEQPTAEEVAV